ncbi:MAG: zinc-binding dehydrogenase [Ardenticatenaceae bacterium]|nr:zinc-binding dehydrogenase [Anaerolineales bacterium]MCB8922671.1 zinc-binding dehydrogenase [Ardenticatenaceae bacterium]MCB8991782.1 zinc-binding dehydrogenase [Ardenticatenaceae bacterium]MCB9003621.1 zinc-binding dehydrogenase [Ardenticatenaceae bacterium]
MGYQRVIMTEFGGPEVLQVVEEATLPEPAADEVRIRALATSACFTDTLVRKGIYFGLKKEPPFAPGYDVVGVVDKVGTAVSTFKVGQTVADLTVTDAYAEYICRPAASLVPVPDGLDPAEAVSLVLSYVTAYQMLHRVAKMQRGQTILIHGAGGAVGTALLELGRLLDLKMYGTASPSKHELIKQLGGIPIDYRREDFVVRVQADGGVDAVFDAIGDAYFKRSFDSLKKGGTLVAYGFYDNGMGKGGSVPLEYMKVKLWNLLPNGRATHFYSIGDLRKKQPGWFREDLAALFDLLARGKIKPVIARRMKLEDAVEAHKMIEEAAVKGRIVLMVNET